MDEKQITCCFTGHRIAKLPWRDDENDPRCVSLKEKLSAVTEAVYESGVRHFICGMANGCDIYFAETVVALRFRHPEVTLEAAVPFEGQADRWGMPLRARYSALLSMCDRQTILQREHTPDCMMRRNRYMVDSASVLIACYDGKSGGTLNTLLYAMRQKVEVIEVPVE
jgi:uncharacterized phage-like protein YoqJ